jgi:hypothetical protein
VPEHLARLMAATSVVPAVNQIEVPSSERRRSSEQIGW